MRIIYNIKKCYFRIFISNTTDDFQTISQSFFPLMVLAGFYRFWIQKSAFYVNAPKLILPLCVV